MIFTTTQLTIKGEPSALAKSGLIIDSEPTSHPFIIGSDSEYILNKARSWLESYNSKGFNNHTNVDSFYLFSVDYNTLPSEHFFLLSFEGRNNPEECVFMQAVYESGKNDFAINFFGLISKNSFTDRSIGNIQLDIAVETFFFSDIDEPLSGFYEFIQHPHFEESVATFTLLNY
jgi:hypothetical protein